MTRRGCFCLPAAVLLSGCLGGAARTEALSRRDAISILTRERDSLWIRSLALAAQEEATRRSAARIETALRDRDEQLQAARLELQRLKEIDLGLPRKPPVE